MAMPLKLIYNVKISRKQKMGLVCVFGLCFVMIAFAIIRAKQVLVPQNFVNLSLLMIWSTLAASICEYTILTRLHKLSTTQIHKVHLINTRLSISCHRRKSPRAQDFPHQSRVYQALSQQFIQCQKESAVQQQCKRPEQEHTAWLRLER
jgi:hypothetical protein